MRLELAAAPNLLPTGLLGSRVFACQAQTYLFEANIFSTPEKPSMKKSDIIFHKG